MKNNSILFYGTEIQADSNGKYYTNYLEIAKKFNAVLSNGISVFFCDPNYTYDVISGADYDDESDLYIEVYQFYIIDNYGVEILTELDELVYYIDELDLYVWGVTHYGTAWDGVPCEIPKKYVDDFVEKFGKYYD